MDTINHHQKHQKNPPRLPLRQVAPLDHLIHHLTLHQRRPGEEHRRQRHGVDATLPQGTCGAGAVQFIYLQWYRDGLEPSIDGNVDGLSFWVYRTIAVDIENGWTSLTRGKMKMKKVVFLCLL